MVLMGDFGENRQMLEYLIEMGIKGNHVLFEANDIRRAFARDVSELVDIDSRTVREVNVAIQKILEIHDIEDKRDFFHELNPRLQDILIHLYFQMIERTMYMAFPSRH